ncbi:hypothetical protein FBQ85_23745 [Cytophagia bacterium CHB2]|nr:hypothetical protein [Cytophagia bacterium CHB2]
MKINLSGNAVLTFETLEEACDWLQKERQAWSWLNGITGQFRDESVPRLFREGWTAVQSSIDNGDEHIVEERLIDLYRDKGKLILADSQFGRYVRRIAEKKTAVANATVICFLKSNLTRFSEKRPGVSSCKRSLGSICSEY